jgi:dTDP-4-dehydrorhamnose 3,5-epimerase
MPVQHPVQSIIYLQTLGSAQMQFKPNSIPDVILIEPRVFSDERGFFMEAYHKQLYSEAGISESFVQDNHSGSRQGTLRGLHYQIRHAQGKLVRVIVGEVFDVAVDLRRSSPTFGKWQGALLSAENRLQVWIPPGFAHGFYVVSDWAEIIYKTTDYYTPEWERTLLWNDAGIRINWPIPEGKQPIISAKDVQGKKLQEEDIYE